MLLQLFAKAKCSLLFIGLVKDCSGKLFCYNDFLEGAFGR